MSVDRPLNVCPKLLDMPLDELISGTYSAKRLCISDDILICCRMGLLSIIVIDARTSTIRLSVTVIRYNENVSKELRR
jgi:hypothetical protein